MIEGFAIGQTTLKGSWQRCLGRFLHGYTEEQQFFHQFDIAFIKERAEHQLISTCITSQIQSSAPCRFTKHYSLCKDMPIISLPSSACPIGD